MNRTTKENESSRRQALMGLGIGENIPFPMTKMSAVRSDCYRYGLEWGKKFSSKVNRKEQAIIVTRTA